MQFRKSLITPFALVLALAGNPVRADGEVNVYSYRQPFLIKPMFDAFTRETGIEVNTVFAREGLVERLVNEGDNSPADLIFTVDIGRLDHALQQGTTQAVDSDLLKTNIPAEFRDPEGHWFGLTNRARIIVTSRERVEPGLVTRYEDLARPQLAGRLCTRSGKHYYMLALIATQIAHHGEEQTRQWLEGVRDNLARKPQGNDRAQVKAIKEGVCDVAVINSYYMGHMLNDEEQSEWANAVDIVFPNQDSYGTHMNISGMALSRSAPNRENAVRLMEFLASDLGQAMYGEQNHEYPVKPDVPASALVRSWGDFKHDSIALSEIAANRATASKMVDVIGYDE